MTPLTTLAMAGCLALGAGSDQILLRDLASAFSGAQELPLDAVVSLSFPSAHAANSMIAWLGLALIAAPPRLRPAAVAAALALALLVGLTRLVLAVHWPSDVIGGWAFGAAWTLLLLRLLEGTSPPLRH